MSKKNRPSTPEEVTKLQTRALEYGFDLKQYDLKYQTKKNTGRICCYKNNVQVTYLTKMNYLGVPDDGGREETFFKNSEDFKDAIFRRLNHLEYQKRKVSILNELLSQIDTSSWLKDKIPDVAIEKIYIKEIPAKSFHTPWTLPVCVELRFGEVNTGIEIDILQEYTASSLSFKLSNEFSNMKSCNLILKEAYAKIFRKKIKSYLNSNTCFHTSMTYNQSKCFAKHNDLIQFLKGYKNNTFFLPNSKVEAVLLKGGKLKCNLHSMIFEYQTQTGKFKCNNETSIKKIVILIKKNSRKINAILKCCDEVSINVSSKKILVNTKTSSTEPTLKLSFEFVDAIDTTQIAKTIKAEIKKQELEKAKEEEATINQLRSFHIYENIMVSDIIYVLLENNYALTENAITKILKGAKGLNHQIKKTKMFGVYNCLTEEDILSVIRNMDKAGLLKQNTIKGSYGRFYVYKVTQKGMSYMTIKHRATKKKAYADFTDYEWMNFLEDMIKCPKEATKKENENQLALFDKKALVCKYPSKVKEFLKQKPESWKNYVETMYSLEDNGLQKKYWKMILNMFQDTD